ncbi:unnamed protein product [Prorocentrum cordatum]|uniref:Uncharacterized protein n=1 Tax=Prorocentrum cordatum TaxID=2364126 RepID=A0ABN9U9S0_9DINO|nr:unnamed protein product [Polarella glacialis]
MAAGTSAENNGLKKLLVDSSVPEIATFLSKPRADGEFGLESMSDYANVFKEEDYDDKLQTLVLDKDEERRWSEVFSEAYDHYAREVEASPAPFCGGPYYRELRSARRNVSLTSSSNVRSDADTRAQGNLEKRDLGGGAGLTMAASARAPDMLPSALLQVLWALKLLATSGGLAGASVVDPKQLYDVKKKAFWKARNCHLKEARAYDDFALRKCMERPGPEASIVQWVLDRDKATRANARALRGAGWPWGEAINHAEDVQCVVQWYCSGAGVARRALAPELPERGVATHQQPAEPLARWLASRGAPSAQSRPALAPQVVAKYETEPRELCRIVTSRCIASAPAAPPAPAAAPAATPPPRRCPPPPDPAAGLPLPAQPASGTPQRRTAGEPSAPPPPARAAAPPPWECPPALDPAAGAPAPSACGPPQERSAGEPSAPPALMRAAVGARLAPGPAAAPAGLAQDSPLFRPQRFDFYRDEGGARAASGAWAPQAASPPPQLEWFPCAWPCSAPAQQPVLSPAHWCGPAPLMQPPLGGASAAGGGFAPPPPPPPERVPVRESVPPPQAAAAHAERDALLASARKLEEKVQELLSGQEGLRHELEQVRMEVRDSSRQFLEQPCGPAAGFQDLPEVGPALMQPTQVLYRSDQWGGPSLQPDTVFYPHAEQQPPSPRREFPQNRLLSQPALQAELVLPGQSTAPPAQTRATYPESARPAESGRWARPPRRPPRPSTTRAPRTRRPWAPTSSTPRAPSTWRRRRTRPLWTPRSCTPRARARAGRRPARPARPTPGRWPRWAPRCCPRRAGPALRLRAEPGSGTRRAPSSGSGWGARPPSSRRPRTRCWRPRALGPPRTRRSRTQPRGSCAAGARPPTGRCRTARGSPPPRRWWWTSRPAPRRRRPTSASAGEPGVHRQVDEQGLVDRWGGLAAAPEVRLRLSGRGFWSAWRAVAPRRGRDRAASEGGSQQGSGWRRAANAKQIPAPSARPYAPGLQSHALAVHLAVPQRVAPV